MITKLTAVLLVVLIAGASASCSVPSSGTPIRLSKRFYRMPMALSKNRSIAGETCFWRVTCSKTLHLSSIETDIGLNKLSILKNAAGASTPNAQTMEELYSFSHFTGRTGWELYVDASDVFIIYTTTEVSDGFDLRVECQQVSPCTAEVSVSGEVTTITGNPPLSDACQFKVNCPNAALVQWVAPSGGALAKVYSNMGSMYQTSLSSPREFVVTSPSFIRMRPYASNSGPLNVSYTCRSSSCSVATGVKTLPSCTSWDGTGCSVTTLGPDTYYYGEYCPWTLRCPEGEFLSLLLPNADPSEGTVVGWCSVYQSPGIFGESWSKNAYSKSAFSVGNTVELTLTTQASGIGALRPVAL